MTLVRRASIKNFIQNAISSFIQKNLPEAKTESWWYSTDDDVLRFTQGWITTATGYTVFSHRWLDIGELTFQDVSRFSKLSVAGFKALMADKTTNRTSAQILDWVIDHTSAETDIPKDQTHKNPGLLEVMKSFCDGLSDEQRDCCRDFVKLVEFCSASAQQDCKFAWFDTGCIDKTRSAELEEAIRSMFKWYRGSKVCIVHLADTTDHLSLPGDPWFTRGWTLQELLAPKNLIFFSKSWSRVTPGKADNDKVPDYSLGIPLWDTISKTTGIPVQQLLGFVPGIGQARDILVWASKRQTTRIEDLAYCLIGLLDIPLSIAYGEGQMSFYRLQVELLQRSPDIGLFAWTGRSSAYNSMLAAGVHCFSPLPFHLLTDGTEENDEFDWNKPVNSSEGGHTLTNRGLRIPLSVYSARAVAYVKEKWPTGLEFDLQVEELREEITVRSSTDLRLCDHLGIAILEGVTDGSQVLGILLVIQGGRCVRVATEDYVKFSLVPKMKEPVIRFVV